MNLMTIVVLSACILLTLIQLGSLLLVRWRLHQPLRQSTTALPFITLARPVCGLDCFDEATLRSSFVQNYPHYEILFCVASPRDPIIPVIKRLMVEFPQQQAQLLIGDMHATTNPKINNLMKATQHSQAEWLVMADSNLLLPPDYLRVLLASATDKTALVSSPAIGIMAENLWGAVEAAMLNTHQARWQFNSDVIGKGFAQGKTLCWRREVLEQHGGLIALGAELAEDVASTKMARNAGLQVTLPPRPFCQPIGRRSFTAVWQRQLRWARIRRFGFFWLFIPEILLGALPALLGSLWLVQQEVIPALVPVMLMALWYGAEWALAYSAGWPHRARDVLAMMIRDLLLPALWLWCWAGRSFTWRGNVLSSALNAPQMNEE
ncbi:ceramide glucosyltransferase [Pantoea sp. A4]|uniref:ceramide glucosyltransferase n=1 Tax=Pantoea sp. A4 TaxID=1225184 RepID=UPI00036F664D|nr:ceramide glucosyltransferase [Pantoea sp. A4]